MATNKGRVAPVYKPRTCGICGHTYHRRNLVEGWTGQNPGHRTGWRKEKLAICTRCQPGGLTTRSLLFVQARVVPPAERAKPS